MPTPSSEARAWGRELKQAYVDLKSAASGGSTTTTVSDWEIERLPGRSSDGRPSPGPVRLWRSCAPADSKSFTRREEARPSACCRSGGEASRHGPHLPIGTDTDHRRPALCEGGRRASSGVPLLPTLVGEPSPTRPTRTGRGRGTVLAGSAHAPRPHRRDRERGSQASGFSRKLLLVNAHVPANAGRF